MFKSFAAALGCAVLAACSGDVCSQQRSLSQTLQSKIGACFGDGGLFGFTGGTYTNCDQNACEAALPSCSPKDLQTIQDELNCQQSALNEVTSDCGVQSLQAAGAAYTACALDGGLAALTSACSQAMATQAAQSCRDAG